LAGDISVYNGLFNTFTGTWSLNGVNQTLTNTLSGATDGAPLFTTGADFIDFNNLTTAQQAAVAGGSNIYHGLGGNDVVTLPNQANYNESVGNGVTLGWTNTAASSFYTESQSGATYTVNGGDGSYHIVEGAGTEFITINGNGSNTITVGSGTDTISVTGNGNNTIFARVPLTLDHWPGNQCIRR
jgi:hypothetical protein